MQLIASLIDLYSLVVLAAIILSWLPGSRHNALGMMVFRLTEPALAPIRRALPSMGGPGSVAHAAARAAALEAAAVKPAIGRVLPA